MPISSFSQWTVVVALAVAGCDAPVQIEEEDPIPVKIVSEVPQSHLASELIETELGHTLEADDTVDSTSETQNETPPSKDVVSETESEAKFRTDWHALLVGCTTYEHLDPESALRGPINDVTLMQKLLIEQYKVLPDQIATLTEGKQPKDRPTKQHIQRELERIESKVVEGDSVVILLSGHGSQQPDNDPDNPEDVEPDGLDEVFLPSDVAPPEDPEAIEIVNGLSDDELREVVTRLRAKGVFVWFLSDSCHSGSSIRGIEKYRQIPSNKFFSKERLQVTQTRGVSNRNSNSTLDLETKLELDGGYVAIYAAQSHEPTIETILPPGEPTSDWRGLMSYTMAKILMESDGTLTYRQLAQRIHAEYVQTLGRLGPTPLIEGTGQDRLVLGGAIENPTSQLVLLKDELDQWKISVGQVHGLSRGSIFEVHPPAGTGQVDSILGYVRIAVAQLSHSLVESVEFNDVPENNNLPLGGVCKLILMKQNRFTLKVAIQESGASTEFTDSIVEQIEHYQEQTGAAIKLVDDPEVADWFVRIDSEHRLKLVPASGWSERSEGSDAGYASELTGDQALDWLCTTLGKISRASGLLKVAGSQSSKRKRLRLGIELPEECDVALELVRMNDGEEPEILNWGSSGLKLDEGDLIALNVINTGVYLIDFSALFVDSQSGIDVMFPQPGTVADNRIAPGDVFTIGPMQVDATTKGLEHLVVIASRAEGQPLDWSWLSQSSLNSEQTRGAPSRRSLQSHTGQLLQDAMFAPGTNRGIHMVKPDTIKMKVISWTTHTSTGP